MVTNSSVLTDSIFEDDLGLFDAITQNYKMEDEIKFVTDYLKNEQTDGHMIKNLELLLSWLSSQNTLLKFEYMLPEMIMESYVAKVWRDTGEEWLVNAFSDETHDKILQFHFVNPNQYRIEHLTRNQSKNKSF